jgi:hypothetical protein
LELLLTELKDTESIHPQREGAAPGGSKHRRNSNHASFRPPEREAPGKGRSRGKQVAAFLLSSRPVFGARRHAAEESLSRFEFVE